MAALAVAAWSLAVLPGWLAWAGCVLGWTLLALAVIDAKHLLLPDTLTLPLVPAGLLVAWAVEPAKLADHAIGAAAGFVVVAAIGLAYRRLRGREGIGLGDAKLFAAAGAWVNTDGSVVQAGTSRPWAAARRYHLAPSAISCPTPSPAA